MCLAGTFEGELFSEGVLETAYYMIRSEGREEAPPPPVLLF